MCGSDRAKEDGPPATPAARAYVSGRRGGVALLAAAAVLLGAPAAASAAADTTAALARRGITAAVRAGWLKPPDARRYRADVYLAQRGVRFLPPLRARVLAVQLAEVSAIWDSYTSPRALALFSQLEENVAYLRTHAIPSTDTDVTGPDGVVYRWFPGKGLEFHPLANFAQLNNLASAKNGDGTRTLADALVARAIPRRGTPALGVRVSRGPRAGRRGHPGWRRRSRRRRSRVRASCSETARCSTPPAARTPRFPAGSTSSSRPGRGSASTASTARSSSTPSSRRSSRSPSTGGRPVTPERRRSRSA